MIRNKAIVNEENSDAEYWKKKYFELIKTGNTDGSTIDISKASISGNENENFTRSWNSVLTKQVKE